MCAPDPFSQVWPRLLETLQALPCGCKRHEPAHRVVTTLSQGVPNCLLDFAPGGMTFKSDRSRNKNFIPAVDFQRVWDALSQAGAVDLDAPPPGLPVRTRIIGAALRLLPCVGGGAHDITHAQPDPSKEKI